MQTLEQELEVLKLKLEELKAKKEISKEISKLQEEISMYEDAISAQNPARLIKLTRMDISDRNERIKGLKEENENDTKYINLLKRRIKEKQKQKNVKTESKQSSIEEFLKN